MTVRRIVGAALEDITVMRALCSIAGEPWKKTDPRLDLDRAKFAIWRGHDDAGMGAVDKGVIHTPFEPHETIEAGDDWPEGWEWGWPVTAKS